MRYLYIINITFCLLLFLCSCSEDGESTRLVIFNVNITPPDKAGSSPEVTIIHNGTNRDEYCGFLVEGTVTDLNQEINTYLSNNRGNINLLNQKKKVITLYGLIPNKTYTFVVFGITSNSARYGQPACKEFNIPGHVFTAKKNPNWNVKYCGKHLYEGNYYSMSSVEVLHSSAEQFFIYEYEPSFVATFNHTEEFLYEAINEYYKRLRTHNPFAFWQEDNQLYTESTNHFFHLGNGDYYDQYKKYVSYAIGMNNDGTPTGNYAHSDTFELGKYPYLESYQYLVGSYIGKWKAISDDGRTQLNARFDDKIANETIKAAWEEFGITDYFTIHYNPHDASLKIKNEQVDANYQKIDGKTVRGETFIKAWYLNNQGDTLLSSSPELAHGVLQKDGTYHFSSMIEGEQTGLMFVFYAEDGRIFFNQSTSIALPFTIIKQN